MIRLAIDAMGGDNAPKEIIEGTILALKNFNDIEVTLFGDTNLMKPYLVNHERLKVVHTDKFIDMGEADPIGQYRHNPDASLFLALKAAKEDLADAVVSAGPTQAVIVGGVFTIKRLPTMKKIAIAPILPSVDNNPKILLDAGGNIDAKPEHLLDFAIFASNVYKALFNVDNPKVGLINIGTEEAKGRELDIAAYELLKSNPYVNFIGNVETKEILTTPANILVSDGFTANIVLKTIEGTAKGIGVILKKSLTRNLISKLATGLFLRGSIKQFKQTLDPNEVGGAMIVGLQKVVVKAHGSSNAYAFSNAIKQARLMVKADIITKVSHELESKPNE